MVERLGDVLYWTGCAAAIAVAGLFVLALGQHDPGGAAVRFRRSRALGLSTTFSSFSNRLL